MPTFEIAFRGMEKSDAIETLVRQHAAKLERFHPRIAGCRVAIERAHRHRRTANDFRVRLDLTLPPRHEIVVVREAEEGGEYHARNGKEALYKLVPQAFNAAARRLKRLSAEQRGDIKRHPAQEVHAIVVRLLDGYGFLQTTDGRELYFHEHSVLDPGFSALRIGAGLAFTEEAGEQGPQASSVRIVDRRGSPSSGATR